MALGRYKPWLTPDRTKWVIFDWKLTEFCTLQDEYGNVLPLEWNTRPAAEAWLQQCYRTWWGWEQTGSGRVPDDWRPIAAEVSPWDRGYRFHGE